MLLTWNTTTYCRVSQRWVPREPFHFLYNKPAVLNEHSPPLQTFVIFLHFSSDIPKSLQKIGSWLWGGILDWCPKLSPWVLHGHCVGQPGFEPQPGTHWYHCPQNNLLQIEDVSHLDGSSENLKNIKQIPPKSLEKKKQKWQKLFGGLELWKGFKSRNFWSLSSLLCLRNYFQMTQLAMPMSCSTAIFFSLLSRQKSPKSQKTSPGKQWH